MNSKFNLYQLKSIYMEAFSSDEKTLIFEISIGRGRFIFMMFVSDEDMESKDRLFIYLRNINYILRIKMYGNHKEGVFDIYITNEIESKLTEELQLNQKGNVFNFEQFLSQLNSSIPTSITNENKIVILRENRAIVGELGAIDEAEKTILIGTVRLPIQKKPQDKTLRKLYAYTDGEYKDITLLIELLKKFNTTVAWRSSNNEIETNNINALINKLKNDNSSRF
ncbi:hypothetical protein BSK62_06440 [Paenibacillus odorifer]|uniref:hypothetical protein n=1 Tax=Paenibacillus TaxID=44249 RepID=UPI00096CC024|nr:MULTISPECIES: hypothetical protein [Paenibacillus]MDH6428053.1 hypothetical protein [Paenibacillus sp. PastH-4]MDH6444317.1 hypothetical protein [Paenibacillus sp. PastF-4]MDH6528218.1 hypothetical protein [Paenibacillus sp. PastH-3]OMD67844.1 hypothetical protein BSK62_06440 [Paenibacillus odorifer]